MITIRRCHASDVPDVLAFLDAHWKRGHIFTTDRSLFDWQYGLGDGTHEYSIIIGRREDDAALVGMLGYIPTRRFDPELREDNAIWLALWKVRDDAASGALGLRLLHYLTEHERHTSIGVIGFQPQMAAIYTALKFEIGELRHYVLPNPDVSRFELASFDRSRAVGVPDTDLTALPLDETNFASVAHNLDLGERNEKTPHKTPEYFCGRYLHHPIYRYEICALRRGDRPVGLLASRLAAHGAARALRVVDFLGPNELVRGLGAIVLAQVRRHGAEYADVLNWGIDAELFDAAGFLRVDPAAGDVVPNHFEPFERRNAPIRFALKTARPAVLFKGDGDQDRPNQRVAP